MIEIPLTRGLVAIIDDEDAHLAAFKWQAMKATRQVGFYAVRTERDRTIYLHREVMQAPDGVRVDHRNRNGLDCRRGNLRSATAAQNAFNVGAHRDNRSGFKGVAFHRRTRKWTAQICRAGVDRYLGIFATAEAAARAYDAAAREQFGEFAHLNFPEAA